MPSGGDGTGQTEEAAVLCAPRISDTGCLPFQQSSNFGSTPGMFADFYGGIVQILSKGAWVSNKEAPGMGNFSLFCFCLGRCHMISNGRLKLEMPRCFFALIPKIFHPFIVCSMSVIKLMVKIRMGGKCWANKHILLCPVLQWTFNLSDLSSSLT